MKKKQSKGSNAMEQEKKAAGQAEAETPVQEAAPQEPSDTEQTDAQANDLEKKCAQYLEMAQRAQADFENYKRRNESARTQAYADGIADALSAMLPVVDNFDRALESIEKTDANKAVLDGVLMVKKQLDDVLSSKGVEAIASEKGGAFDPAVHNAIMTTPAEEGFEAGTLAATFQKGYKLKDKVIRYAMVSVFRE